MAVLHLVQTVAMILIADSVVWSITRTGHWFDPESQSTFPETVSVLGASLPLFVAGSLFVSAVVHTTISTVRHGQ